MEIKHIRTVRPDKDVQNYDHAKFAVYDERGKFRGHVFEWNGEYLTTHTNEYFPTVESAANSL